MKYEKVFTFLQSRTVSFSMGNDNCKYGVCVCVFMHIYENLKSRL